MRARGLKHVNADGTIGTVKSRPMRARGLKQFVVFAISDALTVAPHAGAWIETISSRQSVRRPSVAPHAGAWIETAPKLGKYRMHGVSRPMRARGLKPYAAGQQTARVKSRPMRARGLKHAQPPWFAELPDVAPHAGAWIETGRRSLPGCIRASRPMRARGLKLPPGVWAEKMRRRAPCGRVD